MNKNQDLIEQLSKIGDEIINLSEKEKIPPYIKLEIKHYVLEYWHPNKENFEEVGKWVQNNIIKNRETYKPLDCLYAFQFYDLIEGTKKHNITPLIYNGTREFLTKSTSFIIDKDGDYHPGNTGITYEEYLESTKALNINSIKTKKLNKKN